jgi:hypothetical protein
MEGYFIEFASRTGEFLFRQRIVSLPATVGRALSNDFIIDDPYVAAKHLRLESESPGRLTITDLGSHNGLYQSGRRLTTATLGRGDAVHFGHTTLRVRHVDEPLTPERVDLFSSQAFSLPVALGLLALAIATALFAIPLENFGDIPATTWLMAVLGTLAQQLSWAALWAVLGRIFAGRAQYVTHLAIAGWALLAVTWGDALCGFLAFSLSLPTLAQGRVLLIGLVGVWALHRHLSLAQMRRPALNLPLAVIALAIPTTLSGLENWKQDLRLLDTDLLVRVYDPAWRLTKDQTLEHFMSGMKDLRVRADAVREDGKGDTADEEGGEDE